MTQPQYQGKKLSIKLVAGETEMTKRSGGRSGAFSHTGVQPERTELEAGRLLQWLFEGMAKAIYSNRNWFSTHSSSSGSCSCRLALVSPVTAADWDRNEVRQTGYLTRARSAIVPVAIQHWLGEGLPVTNPVQTYDAFSQSHEISSSYPEGGRRRGGSSMHRI